MCIKGRATPWEKVYVKLTRCKRKRFRLSLLLRLQRVYPSAHLSQGVALGLMLVGLSDRHLPSVLRCE